MRTRIVTQENSVGQPSGIRRRAAVRSSLAARSVRTADRVITRIQEWLEGTDRRVDMIVAYGIIAAALIYFVGQLLL
ncbi:MAG: hypothetical protein NC238_08985 [Dehalobacter sp.]|nr:hypothetical protein [Dehalobacter sp.]